MVELGLRRNGGATTSAERERVEGFGRLENMGSSLSGVAGPRYAARVHDVSHQGSV